MHRIHWSHALYLEEQDFQNSATKTLTGERADGFLEQPPFLCKEGGGFLFVHRSTEGIMQLAKPDPIHTTDPIHMTPFTQTPFTHAQRRHCAD